MSEKPSISHRLVPDAGVIVVEITQALGPQDFDALSATADEWINAKGNLNGIVLHADHFPGWESLQGVIKHIRFVRDHHRKVKRIALVTDAKLATLASSVAEHFVESELKNFAYGKLDEAIAWARGDAK